ncbi:MAG: riboflavin synthase, partial [Phycisphaerales bacterium]
GEAVNLEHAATAATLLGGHIVQGHVDGVGTVERVSREGGEWRTRIAAPPSVMEHAVERGSVAVDGVSLTIAAAGDGWFEVASRQALIERLTTFPEGTIARLMGVHRPPPALASPAPPPSSPARPPRG